MTKFKIKFEVNKFAPNLWRIELDLAPHNGSRNAAVKRTNDMAATWYSLSHVDKLTSPYREGRIAYANIPLVCAHSATFTPNIASVSAFELREWTPEPNARSYFCHHSLSNLTGDGCVMSARVEFDFRQLESDLWFHAVEGKPVSSDILKWAESFPQCGSMVGMRERMMTEFIKTLEADLTVAFNNIRKEK